MLSLVLAATLSTTPTPLPTLPPEIIRITTSPGCETLARVNMPVGFVSRYNDRAFRAMAYATQKFLSHIMPGDVPTTADLDLAFGNDPLTNGAGNGTGTALSAAESSTTGDDPIIYGPQQTIDASRIDQVAQQIFENVRLEQQYVDKSLKEYPPGSDPKVDALRAQAQNMIALQQAVASRYEQFAGEYIDNMGVAEMTNMGVPGSGGEQQGQQSLASFKIALRGLLLGQTQGLSGDEQVNENAPYYGYGSIQNLAKSGSTGEVVSALRRQEYEFSNSLIGTYNQCHATHFVLRPPSQAAPSPSPSP